MVKQYLTSTRRYNRVKNFNDDEEEEEGAGNTEPVDIEHAGA